MFNREMGANRVATAAAMLRATWGYWLGVFPRVARELSHWRDSAHAIPDPGLQLLALEALAKRGNMEGAAAFATFAPQAHRDAVVRATVAFQAAYNYLDLLAEQPNGNPGQNSRRLHRGLLVALDPAATHVDYYEHHSARADGGHLVAMLDACRSALSELPAYSAVAPAARRAATRVVAFQGFQADVEQSKVCGQSEAERWARAQTPAGGEPRWWETLASGGSSLGVHVMLATAAERGVTASEVAALENAYFPWIGALHTMLDHLVDAAEDAAAGQRNLIDCYASPEQAVERLGALAERSLGCARSLRPAARHTLIVAAMTAFYLSDPEASAPAALSATRAVLDTFGPLVTPALAIFKTREAAGRVYYACRRDVQHDAATRAPTLLTGHRG